MFKLLIFFLLIPLLGYGQNLIPHADLQEVTETNAHQEFSDYKLYELRISAGYKDNGYKLEVINPDSTIFASVEVNVKLIIHSKDYNAHESKKKLMNYETEIKSNNRLADEVFEIGDCSKTKYLTCLIRLKKTENYRIIVWHKEYERFEFLEQWNIEKRM